jgi:DNA-binding GntR family transcriptional regulator
MYDKEAVFQALTDEIVSGALAPGTPLPERSLVERFGISRTPIRQVLWMLERDRLVDVLPNRGAFVKKLGVGEVIELFQLREALEPLAARLAATHRPAAEASTLLARMLAAEAGDTRDTKELVALGAELHDALARWSGNRMLQRIYETLRMQTHLLRNLLHESDGSERSSLSEHISIVTAVEQRDDDAAFTRMSEHLRRARLAIIADLFSPTDAVARR